MEFAELVRSARAAKFKSAKEFFSATDLPCSYFYYSSVEKETVPSLEIALAIIDALGIDKRKGLCSWVRSQMPDEETRAFFTALDDVNPPSGGDVPNSKALVVNRMQARFLEEYPVAMEILIYINTHDVRGPIPVADICTKFSMVREDAELLLSDLFDFGLIEKNERGRYFAREWVFIPFEKDFDPLKESNFRRAYQQFLRQKDDKLRNAVTIRVTQGQRKEIEAKVVSLVDWLVSLECKGSAPGAVPYTFGVFGSPRRFGDV